MVNNERLLRSAMFIEAILSKYGEEAFEYVRYAMQTQLIPAESRSYEIEGYRILEQWGDLPDDIIAFARLFGAEIQDYRNLYDE